MIRGPDADLMVSSDADVIIAHTTQYSTCEWLLYGHQEGGEAMETRRPAEREILTSQQ